MNDNFVTTARTTSPGKSATNDNPPNNALGLETVSGEIIGRDPRGMTTAELHALGHSSNSVLGAIREKCIDCCGGEKTEARKCVAILCTLWPFRMGVNPMARRSLSDDQKAAAVERMKDLNIARYGQAS